MDHLAVRFPRAHRGLAALAWRVAERLRPGHPVRRALAERLISRSYGAFNRNDLEALLPQYHPDCVWDWSNFEGWPEEQVMQGPEGMRRGWLVFRDAWGELRVEASDWRDFGAHQLVTCHMRATGSGSGAGLQRTWWQVGHVRDGLIALVANYTDHRQALEAARRPE